METKVIPIQRQLVQSYRLLLGTLTINLLFHSLDTNSTMPFPFLRFGSVFCSLRSFPYFKTFVYRFQFRPFPCQRLKIASPLNLMCGLAELNGLQKGFPNNIRQLYNNISLEQEEAASASCLPSRKSS